MNIIRKLMVLIIVGLFIGIGTVSGLTDAEMRNTEISNKELTQKHHYEIEKNQYIHMKDEKRSLRIAESSDISTISSQSQNIDWWTSFRHDNQNTGKTTDHGTNGHHVLWNVSTDGSIHSSPAIWNEKVYVGSCDGNLYCINADTGGIIWYYNTNSEVVSSPAIWDEKVFFGSDQLYCLHAESGEEIWHKDIGSSFISSPAVSDGRVYIGSVDHDMYCVDADKGDILWNYTTGDSIQSSPALIKGRVYVGSLDGKLYCIEANTGRIVWIFTTDNEVYSSPAIWDEKVFFGSDQLYCLNAESGVEIWHKDIGSTIISSPSVSDGKVIIGSDKIYCFGVEYGNIIWSYVPNKSAESSPAIADGWVYIGSNDGFVYCLDEDNGREHWVYYTGDEVHSSPGIAAGNVYVGSYNNLVYCFGSISQSPKVPSITGPHSVQAGDTYIYNISTTDPEGDKIWYRIIWGDGTGTEWLGPSESGQKILVSKTWITPGTYDLWVKARDESGAVSDWKTMEVSVPKTKQSMDIFINQFLENHPHLLPLLKHIFIKWVR